MVSTCDDASEDVNLTDIGIENAITLAGALLIMVSVDGDWE